MSQPSSQSIPTSMEAPTPLSNEKPQEILVVTIEDQLTIQLTIESGGAQATRQSDTTPQTNSPSPSTSSSANQTQKTDAGSQTPSDIVASQIATPLQAVMSSSTIASARAHSRTSSTSTSLSESGDNLTLSLLEAGIKDRQAVDNVMAAKAGDLTRDGQGVGFKTKLSTSEEDNAKATIRETPYIRTARQGLSDTRSSSYFDVNEGNSTPRRWRRMMDRNALANPGASSYTQNSS